MSGEMPLKERLVDRDVLQPDDALAVLDLENAIHQQERIAVRQDFHDLFDLDHRRLLRNRRFHGAHQCDRSAMTRLDAP